MITGSDEYLEYLKTLSNSYNPPNILIRIPTDEPVYEINLKSRVISPPKFIGVEADHEAEILYFQVDRYFDNMDLSQCLCGVQFKNAHGEEYIYIIPAYDILSIPGKMIISWDIQSPATKYGGTVEFAFKFFKIDKTSGELLYELNTQVCKTKVLNGWANYKGANHNYNVFTVDQVLTSPDIEPILDAQGNPVGVNPNEPISDSNPPAMRVTGYGIWSKIQEIFDKNKEFHTEWLDL
jgi:hypothetical protein